MRTPLVRAARIQTEKLVPVAGVFWRSDRQRGGLYHAEKSVSTNQLLQSTENAMEHELPPLHPDAQAYLDRIKSTSAYQCGCAKFIVQCELPKLGKRAINFGDRTAFAQIMTARKELADQEGMLPLEHELRAKGPARAGRTRRSPLRSGNIRLLFDDAETARRN